MTILTKTEDVIKKKYKVPFHSVFCSPERVPQIVHPKKSVAWTRSKLNTLFLWLSLPFGKGCVKFSLGRDPKGEHMQQKGRCK